VRLAGLVQGIESWDDLRGLPTTAEKHCGCTTTQQDNAGRFRHRLRLDDARSPAAYIPLNNC